MTVPIGRPMAAWQWRSNHISKSRSSFIVATSWLCRPNNISARPPRRAHLPVAGCFAKDAHSTRGQLTRTPAHL